MEGMKHERRMKRRERRREAFGRPKREPGKGFKRLRERFKGRGLGAQARARRQERRAIGRRMIGPAQPAKERFREGKARFAWQKD